MQIIADLQLHSRFSRAVSKHMTIPHIGEWCRRKGIDLVATGDWTHPMWMREIESSLEEMGNGLLKIKNQNSNIKNTDKKSKNEILLSPLFLLATEISCIYSQGGKTRRIHTLVWVPTIQAARHISQEMTKRGCNLLSDGRPIVGLTSIQLAELVLSVEPQALVIPAHAWTPWFSVYGALGGFDTIEEAFGPFAKHIYAVETGLSSSPAMNWRIKELDGRTILSFSDAHSGPKIGREATVFEVPDGKLSYEAIYEAIKPSRAEVAGENFDAPPVSLVEKAQSVSKTRSHSQSGVAQNFIGSPHASHSRNSQLSAISPHIAYTIEFHPEEGKYHYTGHRNCSVRLSPEEVKKKGATCPVCGKPLTMGVMERVEELAGRPESDLALETVQQPGIRCDVIRSRTFPGRPGYVMLVPLLEILSECIPAPVTSPKTLALYTRVTDALGGEFPVLLTAPKESIAKVAGDRVADAIERVRHGKIVVEPGYDGVFGVVKIWKDGNGEGDSREQLSMF